MEIEKASPDMARPFCIWPSISLELVDLAADGADELGGTIGCFHDSVGGSGAAV